MKAMTWGKIKVIGAVLGAVAVIGGGTPLVSQAASAEPGAKKAGLPAFPGAEGFGAVSKGGRGGKVIKVTTLDPSGPGSLQWACNQDGPRIIVFDVSGVIKPPNSSGEGRWLSIKEDRVTIAGQTAPGAGITIEGMLSVSRTCSRKLRTRPELGNPKKNVHDVVLRFLRLRPTYGHGNLRTLETRSARRIIVDHVSGSWSRDQCFNAGGDAEEMTFQWCAIEETDIGLEGAQPHAFGFFGSYNTVGNVTVHHSLMAHHMGRAPDFDENYQVDWRNNLLYNVGFDETVFRWMNRKRDKSRKLASFALIGNTWRTGPGGMMGTRAYGPPLTLSRPGFLPDHRTGRHRFEGNRFEWEGLVGPEKYTGGEAGVLAKAPFPMPPVETHTADEAYDLVLASTGCLPRDSVSARTVAEVRTRTGSFGRQGPDAGLMEGLTVGKAPSDGDKDGMPDEWEKAHGLNPADPADNNKIVPAGASPGDRHKGYTYIEYYINELADIKVAAALTKARLDRSPPQPWAKPATTLSPQGGPHKSLDEIVKAVREQNAEREKDPKKRRRLGSGWYAVQQLGRMGAKAAPAVPELIEGLGKGKENRREVSFSAWALGAIGPPAKAAVPALITALKSEQSTEQGKYNFRPYGFLAWALGRIGMTEAQAREAAPVLGKLMHGADGWSRPNAAWALSGMGKSAEPAMKDLLGGLGNQRFSTTGYLAARALANIGGPAVPGLIKALAGGDDLARGNAARALGWMSPAAKDTVLALIQQLKKDSSGAVRGRVALALAKIAPESNEVVTALAGALGDGFLDVRVSAAMALGKCGPAAKGAIPALQKALADKRREVKRAAALALGGIGKAALPALQKALAGGDPFVRKYAARALGDLGAVAVTALTKALADKNAEVRREAVWSLALVGKAAGSATAALESAAKKDSDHVVRYAAGVALKKLR